MKKIWTKLSFILCLVFLFMFLNNSLKINAKVDFKDIEKTIDKFFEVRDQFQNITYKNESRSLKSTGFNVKSTNDLEDFFTKDFKIKDSKLRDYFINYIKLRDVITQTTDLEYEVIKDEITKNIMEKDNKIIVSVKRYFEYYATIDGIKSTSPSFEVPEFKFVFDKNTGELIEYIPLSSEEMTYMKADMPKLIESERISRLNKKSLSFKNANNGSSNIYLRASVNLFNNSNMLPMLVNIPKIIFDIMGI